MSTLNFISVIVTTRNRSTLLNNFLFFIQNQTIKYSDYEIIVIDNGSNDKTFTIVENHKKKSPTFVIFMNQCLVYIQVETEDCRSLKVIS